MQRYLLFLKRGIEHKFSDFLIPNFSLKKEEKLATISMNAYQSPLITDNITDIHMNNI